MSNGAPSTGKKYSSVAQPVSQFERTKRRSRRLKASSQDFDLTIASTISSLIFATIWGVLARLGLTWIGGFSSSVVFPLIWAQILGCLIMGANTERKADVEAIYPPLFAAIGTGFCGSLTTFSTYIYEVFLEFANEGRPSAGRFQGFMSGVAMTLITLGMATVALRVGVHLGSSLSLAHPISTKPHRSISPKVHLIVSLVGPLFWLGSVMLLAFGPHAWRHRATFAIVLGPPGTLLRYYLAKKLNARITSFPVGTFTANMLAVLIEAVIAILQRRPGPRPGSSMMSSVGCSALQGTLDGFCGSLSTVSTFVVELRTLERRDSYLYFFASWAGGLLLMVVLLGSWIWSGDRAGVCRP